MKRQGKKKANIASAHFILTIAYSILKTGKPYEELGPNYLHPNQKSKEEKMIELLTKKGYTISSPDQQTA